MDEKPCSTRARKTRLCLPLPMAQVISPAFSAMLGHKSDEFIGAQQPAKSRLIGVDGRQGYVFCDHRLAHVAVLPPQPFENVEHLLVRKAVWPRRVLPERIGGKPNQRVGTFQTADRVS